MTLKFQSRRQNFDFGYAYFCPHLLPIGIPILYKNHLILLKLSALYDICLRCTHFM